VRITDPFGIREPELTAPEVARRAGVSLALAHRLWRALGLPEIEDSEVFFDDDDVASLTSLREIIDLGLPEEDLVVLARVYGESLSRIADAQTRIFKERILDPMAVGGDARELRRRISALVPKLLALIQAPLTNSLMRHQAIAMQRLLVSGDDAGDGGRTMCAGFVDLVDFSRIAEDLSGADLTELVSRFEDLAIEICADLGVRLVKVIGDAAMFVSNDASDALAAATGIVERVEGDELLPHARAGLDLGEVVPLGGDYFGHAVNVASRITAFARPGTVVVSGDVLDAVGDVDVGKIGTQRLKGVGRETLFKVRF
jgi:adenylate cyclase